MVEEKTKRLAVVTGDVTMDWNIASFRDITIDLKAKYWASGSSSRAYWQRGGAVVVANLIDAVAKTLPKEMQYDVRQTAAPRHEISPCDDRFHHTYTMWAPHKFCEKPPLDKEKFAWRVEHFLGFDRSTTGTSKQDWHMVVHDDPDADLIVLDDSNLDFRDNQELWPKALDSKKHKPWVVLKMNGPLAQGKLWETLVNEHAERLIVIAPINDLRRTGIQISRHLSWERTAQDVVWELTNNPLVNGLARGVAVIISFNTAGAILTTWKSGHANASLFFDPLIMEDDFEQLYPGKMYGYTSCLTAAIARQIMLAPDQLDLQDGVQRGVAAMRILHMEGYGTRGTPASRADLVFPATRIAEIIEHATPFMSVVSIQDPTRFLVHEQTDNEVKPKRGYWTIMEERYAVNLENIARQIIIEGFESALRNVPVGRFGALVNVDRREIEALHSIQRLIAEYCLETQKRPLSIAVFGPPGSGKSYGVEQVAKSILSNISVVNFNLSQFGQPEDLLDALHQVRDVGLTGKIPLVFWDEFDSALAGQSLGWLRYFISPMQDGTFQQGQISHPIGRCIFVFVGGTSHNMEEFGSHIEENRMVKLPDFISRLKGFLDILGPNPIEEGEQYFILRRAIVLRSLLERNTPAIFQNISGKKVAQIDLGVLRAMLRTTTYKHGVRSMESIIAMSTLAGKLAFERSSLPPEEQLKLHVDARNFLALVQQIELEGVLLEKLAEALHENYCKSLIKLGYKYGPVTNEKKKILSILVPYPQLSEELKEMNRANIRDIPTRLAKVGYVMRPARSDQERFEFPLADIEKLAKKEHVRYVDQLVGSGWTYGSLWDDIKKTNPEIVDWEQLSKKVKENDRVMVRAIPVILANAGFAIEKA